MKRVNFNGKQGEIRGCKNVDNVDKKVDGTQCMKKQALLKAEK